MSTDKARRIVLIIWLLGVAVLCLWTPHTQGHGSAVYYGWAWLVVWHPAPYPTPWRYAQIDHRLIGLTLAAWTAILGAAFLVVRSKVKDSRPL